jgi:hypothetical protein
MNPHTAKSLEEEIAEGIKARPAWLKLDDTSRCYPISRSRLYELIRDGKIRSACLRDRNKVRGTRIVNVESLERYITKHEDVWSESPNPKTKNETTK